MLFVNEKCTEFGESIHGRFKNKNQKFKINYTHSYSASTRFFNR
jgi:hypothetical protein